MFDSPEIKNINENIMNLLTNKKFIILSIILFIIFLGLSIYIYINYIKPRIFNNYVANSEFIDPGKDNKIIIMYFYTEWCPYCKVAFQEWSKFKKKVNERTFDIPIIFKEIDCDIYTEVADEYNIEGYPTIKLLYKENVYEYDAKPDNIHLMEFLEGSLPGPSPFSKKEIDKDVKEVTDELRSMIK